MQQLYTIEVPWSKGWKHCSGAFWLWYYPINMHQDCENARLTVVSMGVIGKRGLNRPSHFHSSSFQLPVILFPSSFHPISIPLTYLSESQPWPQESGNDIRLPSWIYTSLKRSLSIRWFRTWSRNTILKRSKQASLFLIWTCESSYQLQSSKSQYEYRLKTWGIQKNVSKKVWKQLGLQLPRRIGKQTEITHLGIPISERRVRRETQRYRAIPTANEFGKQCKSDRKKPSNFILSIVFSAKSGGTQRPVHLRPDA